MIKIIKKMLLEPLFHFLIVGFALYLFYDDASGKEVQSLNAIEISSQELREIESEYKKEFNADISQAQLKASIQKRYYEKILLNEAYSLGLEKQDKEIAKRLLAQMQHILRGVAVAEPSEELLKQYFEKNKSDYSVVHTLSLSHIYFSNPQYAGVGDTLKTLQIADIKPVEASSFGETPAMPSHIKDITLSEAQEMFGNYFALKLFNLKQGKWHKPIQSKHGTHLVYVTDKNVSEAYVFDEIQERVYEDYLEEERAKKENEAYKKISSQYSLEVK